MDWAYASWALVQVADSCLPPTQHTVEYKALKFGDQLDSHVLVPLQSKTFKKNFEVSFEFRTYYPNGLFFIASVSLCDLCSILQAGLMPT